MFLRSGKVPGATLTEKKENEIHLFEESRKPLPICFDLRPFYRTILQVFSGYTPRGTFDCTLIGAGQSRIRRQRQIQTRREKLKVTLFHVRDTHTHITRGYRLPKTPIISIHVVVCYDGTSLGSCCSYK
ncbi:hypothetical protein ANTQUA_LOCUS334 [Anthophora quadrimaculata]